MSIQMSVKALFLTWQVHVTHLCKSKQSRLTPYARRCISLKYYIIVMLRSNRLSIYIQRQSYDLIYTCFGATSLAPYLGVDECCIIQYCYNCTFSYASISVTNACQSVSVKESERNL